MLTIKFCLRTKLEGKCSVIPHNACWFWGCYFQHNNVQDFVNKRVPRKAVAVEKTKINNTKAWYKHGMCSVPPHNACPFWRCYFQHNNVQEFRNEGIVNFESLCENQKAKQYILHELNEIGKNHKVTHSESSVMMPLHVLNFPFQYIFGNFLSILVHFY